MLKDIFNRNHCNIKLYVKNEETKDFFINILLNKILINKKIIYLSPNLFDILNSFKIIKKIEIKFVIYEKLDDIIEFFFNNNIENGTIIFFDKISILNLEIKNKIAYYSRFNMILCYLYFMSFEKNLINIFITEYEREPLLNLLNYWSDYEIKIFEENKQLRAQIKMDSSIISEINIIE